MESKAERNQKSDASPVEFCRRSLAEGNVWNSLTDLLKISKLQGVGADNVKVFQEIVQHLFTNIVNPACSKRYSQQAVTHVDQQLFQLVDDMYSNWDADSILDRAQESVKETTNEHVNYNTAELDRSCSVKKGAATRRRLGEQVALNMHTMGTCWAGR